MPIYSLHVLDVRIAIAAKIAYWLAKVDRFDEAIQTWHKFRLGEINNPLVIAEWDDIT